MRLHITLLFALLVSALPWAELRAVDNEKNAVQMVKKLQGRVTRDDKIEGKPVCEVDLENTDITDEDLQLLTVCKQLRSLNLSGCSRLRGLNAIAAFQQLQKLNLNGGTELTDAEIQNLAACKQLQVLNLSFCHRVTHLGLKQLVPTVVTFQPL